MIKFVQRFRWAASRLRGFRKDERGIAALEFAMISPLFIALFFGTVEVSQAVAIDRKSTLLARTLADLVSQYSNVADSDMNNIFLAGTAVMTPYAAGTTQLKSIVTAVNVSAAGIATVAWSDTKYGNDSSTSSTKFADYTLNQVVTLPTALAVPNTQLIWSQVTYTYTSPVSHFIIGNKLLKEQNYVRPRQTSTVTRSVS
jgi:Flp pilus assembly protein TadG